MNPETNLWHRSPNLWIHRWGIQVLATIVTSLTLACGGGGGGGNSTPPAAPTTPEITIPTAPSSTTLTTTQSYTASVATQSGCTYTWVLTGDGSVTGGGTTSDHTLTFTAGTTGNTVDLSCTVTNAAGTPSTPGTAHYTIVAAVNHILTVTITGVNPADVSLSGPGVTQNLTHTTDIDCTAFANGTFTLTANNVLESGNLHYPWQRTKTVTVTSGVPSVNALTVLYPALTTTVNIPNISGIPATIPMDFVLVPPGPFTMGTDNTTSYDCNWVDATPAHTVTIPHAFYVAKYPCTQAQWMAVTNHNPSYCSSTGGGALPDDFTRPVESVSWNNIRDAGTGYLDMLNASLSGYGFRLPTEAEYEYIVRAGTSTDYYFGNDFTQLGTYAWFNQASTQPVGGLSPNPWGLYDITGNVWEWCEDNSHGSHNQGPPEPFVQGYLGAPTDGTAWVDSGTLRILRGGGWAGNDDLSPRSAFRFDLLPTDHNRTTGFRVVMSVPGAE